MKPKKPIESLIFTIRDQKVILDADLAELYGVSTGVLNQAVRRNEERFPVDFCFQITASEWRNLKSQIVISSAQVLAAQGTGSNWSQIATSAHGGRRTLPFAFTEHGAMMAANVLNSPDAIKMSVYVIRAFVQMRETIAANAAILKRLAEIDKTLLSHDHALRAIWTKLQPLLAPPPDPPRRRIGFEEPES
jgi:hypothetical protein